MLESPVFSRLQKQKVIISYLPRCCQKIKETWCTFACYSSISNNKLANNAVHPVWCEAPKPWPLSP